jgi:hypothetical protein
MDVQRTAGQLVCSVDAPSSSVFEGVPIDLGSGCGTTFVLGFASRRVKTVRVEFGDRPRPRYARPRPGPRSLGLLERQIFVESWPGDADVDRLKALDADGRVVAQEAILYDDLVTHCTFDD